ARMQGIDEPDVAVAAQTEDVRDFFADQVVDDDSRAVARGLAGSGRVHAVLPQRLPDRMWNPVWDELGRVADSRAPATRAAEPPPARRHDPVRNPTDDKVKAGNRTGAVQLVHVPARLSADHARRLLLARPSPGSARRDALARIRFALLLRLVGCTLRAAP